MVYKITFQMQTPLIISDALHLDALLMAVHPEAKDIIAVNRDLRDDALIQLPLPISKARIGDAWIWLASSIEFDSGVIPYKGVHTKRKSNEDVFYLEKNLMTIGGVFKDMMVNDFGYVASTAHFYAESSDRKQLASLCKRISYLGKNRGMGYGRVFSVRLSECSDMCWQDVLVRDGIALRNLPRDFLVNTAGSSIIANPPYWGMYRRGPGAAPGEAAVLKEGIQICF